MRAVPKRLCTAAISVVLILAVAASAAFAAPAVAPTDVPKDHWAYDAVTMLVNKGYMGVYESGQFRGEDPVSRYLLAFVVARFLRDAETGRTSLSDQDMEIVRQVSTNLRDELSVMQARLAEIEKAASDAKSGIAITNDSLARVARQYAEISVKLEDQRKQLSLEIVKTADLADQRLAAAIADAKAEAQDRLKLDSRVTAELTNMTKSVVANKSQIDAAAAQIASTQARQESLSLSLDGALKSIEAMRAWAAAAMQEETRARGDADAALDAAFLARLATERAECTKDIDQLRGQLSATKAELSSTIASAQAGAEAGLNDEARARASGDEKLSLDLGGLRLALMAKDDELAKGLSLSMSAMTKELDDRDAALSAAISKAVADYTTALGAERRAREDALAQWASSFSRGQEELKSSTAASLSAAIDSERTERGVADDRLSLSLSGFRAEYDAYVKAAADASAALAGQLDAEKLAREAGDELLGKAVADAMAAVSSEQQARAKEDGALASKIGAEIAALGLSLDSKYEALAKRDGELYEAITASTGDLSAKIADSTNAERQAREAGDARLASEAASMASALRAEMGAVASEGSKALAATSDSLASRIGLEEQARLDEMKKLREDLASAGTKMADLDQKAALADAAIISTLQAESVRIDAVNADLVSIRKSIEDLRAYTARVEADLAAMSDRTSKDYSEQRAALSELSASLDQTAKSITDRIVKNEAEALKTSAKVIENAMLIRDAADLLGKTRDSLNRTSLSLSEAQASIQSINTRIASIDERLASMERMMQGSVDELKKRFADDLVAERWEAEAREIKLQSRIEELEGRVGRLEGLKAEADAAAAKGGSAGLWIGLAAAAALIAVLIGSGSK
ncbi:MAG: S-layer homology domain-containing protein [Clostridia bacterium]|nr:S-layer homology domain-containing protein [Clostridia bacterium]